MRLVDLQDWRRRVALGEMPTAIQVVEIIEELIHFKILEDDD